MIQGIKLGVAFGDARATHPKKKVPDISSTVFAEAVGRLYNYERALHKLAEDACNRELSAGEQKYETQVEEAATAAARTIGLNIRFNREPRGPSIILFGGWLPPAASNRFDGEGWSLYD